MKKAQEQHTDMMMFRHHMGNVCLSSMAQTPGSFSGYSGQLEV